LPACEHRAIVPNRPDARKSTLQNGLCGPFRPRFGALPGLSCEHRRKWPHPPRCSQDSVLTRRSPPPRSRPRPPR